MRRTVFTQFAIKKDSSDYETEVYKQSQPRLPDSQPKLTHTGFNTKINTITEVVPFVIKMDSHNTEGFELHQVHAIHDENELICFQLKDLQAELSLPIT